MPTTITVADEIANLPNHDNETIFAIATNTAILLSEFCWIVEPPEAETDTALSCKFNEEFMLGILTEVNNRVSSGTMTSNDLESIHSLIDFAFDQKVQVITDQQTAFVSNTPEAIVCIKNPSESVQIAAVTQNGIAIKDLFKTGANVTDAVKLAAVSQNGRVIKYINNPSEATQLAAVTNTGYAIKFIIRKGIIPSEAVKDVARSKGITI